jgi:hypothetical protein
MPLLQAGNYSINAAYDGDGNNAKSAPSNCVAITVNALPVAAFVVTSPLPYLVGQSLTFNATTSFDPDSLIISDKIVSYSWNLGDGPANGLIVGHAYSTPGDYTVILTVTDKYGTTSTVSRAIRVDTLIVQVSSVPSTNSTSVGSIVKVTVNVTNSGTLGLNLTVTLDVNGITVDRKPLTLAGGQDSGSFTLSWDTASYSSGTYSVTVRIASAKTLGSSPTSVSIPAVPETSQVKLTAVNQTSPLPGGPIPWIILGVLVVVGAASYLLFRRRRKTQTI